MLYDELCGQFGAALGRNDTIRARRTVEELLRRAPLTEDSRLAWLNVLEALPKTSEQDAFDRDKLDALEEAWQALTLNGIGGNNPTWTKWALWAVAKQALSVRGHPAVWEQREIEAWQAAGAAYDEWSRE